MNKEHKNKDAHYFFQSRVDFLQIMINAQKGEGGEDQDDTSTVREGEWLKVWGVYVGPSLSL